MPATTAPRRRCPRGACSLPDDDGARVEVASAPRRQAPARPCSGQARRRRAGRSRRASGRRTRTEQPSSLPVEALFAGVRGADDDDERIVGGSVVHGTRADVARSSHDDDAVEPELLERLVQRIVDEARGAAREARSSRRGCRRRSCSRGSTARQRSRRRRATRCCRSPFGARRCPRSEPLLAAPSAHRQRRPRPSSRARSRRRTRLVSRESRLTCVTTRPPKSCTFESTPESTIAIVGALLPIGSARRARRP